MPFPLLPLAMGAGKAFLAAGATKLAGSLVDKVSGVPTPAVPPGGSEAGAYSRDFMDQAYPGTNPWDRLGHGGAPTAVESAGVTTRSAQDMQKREFLQQQRIADMNNRAAIISSASPGGALERESKLRAYMSGENVGYPTELEIHQQKLGYEKSRGEAEAGSAQTRRKLMDLVGQGTDSLVRGIEKGSRWLGEKSVAAEEWLANRGSRPRRFHA